MGYVVQQRDIEMLQQTETQKFVRIELLNKDMLVADTLEGDLISDNFTVDASSDIRRTYEAVFYVKDSSFFVDEHSKIWLDKYLRIYTGTKYFITGEVIWYPMGIYLMNDTSYTYDSSACELSLSCVDLTGMLNDTFSGQVTGALTTTIPMCVNEGQSGIEVKEKYSSVLAGTIIKVPVKNKAGFVQICMSGSVSITINDAVYTDEMTDYRFETAKSGIIEITFNKDCDLKYIDVYYDHWQNDEDEEQSDDTLWTFRKNDGYGAHPRDIKGETGYIYFYKKTDSGYEVDKSKGFLTVDGTTPAYTYIREAMKDTVEQLGHIKKYIIEDMGKTIPYDLEFGAGSTVYDIIAKLRDLYSGWETFFDTDGTFICQKYPTNYEDEVVLTADVLEPLIVSENVSGSFSAVRNVTEVWGKSLTANYYTEICEVTKDGYKATFEDMTLADNLTVQNNILIGIKIPEANNENPIINIVAQNGESYAETGNITVLNNDDGIIRENQFKKDVSYVFKSYQGKLYFLGQFQIHALAIETAYERTEEEKEKDKINYNCENIVYTVNPQSPFSVEKIGERRQVLNGDDFELIYADDLAMERAEYENWKTTRLQDTITLEMITIPWLDVNKKIEYKSQITGETNQYIVKSVKGSTTAGTMTIEIMRFYPEYMPENE